MRKLLEERPNARVAVVVPGLEKQRAEIDRVFREVLAPELEDIAASANSGPFEFSVGTMLADTPMVAVALDLLRWHLEALAAGTGQPIAVVALFCGDRSGTRSARRVRCVRVAPGKDAAARDFAGMADHGSRRFTATSKAGSPAEPIAGAVRSIAAAHAARTPLPFRLG